MGIEKIRGMSGRGTGFVAIGALVACSWIVGCGGESDDDDGGDDGGTAGTSAGKGGTSGGKGGTAGSTSGASGTGNAGSGGTAGATGGVGGTQGGSAGTTGGTAGEASGGEAGDGVGGTGGDGNVGGEAGASGGTDAGEGGTGGTPPDDPTVRGRIIDFYGHPVPGITIGINGTDVVTNAQGQFTFENVPDVYDASFVVQNVPNREYAWVFQGLTRRDPTLQVFQGVPERGMGTDWRATDGAPTATQNLTVAVGSEYGAGQVREIPANGRDSASLYWFGPAASPATGHALMWSYDEDSELPTNYVSYTTFPFVLEENLAERPLTNVSVAPTEITQANIGGTVTDLVETGRVNYAFVRFANGATIDLFTDDPGPGTFSYLVPALPNGTVTFAASDENWPSREFAIVHQEVVPGTTNLALAIPMAASLTAPADGEDTLVDDETEFRYQNRQDGVGAVVVRLEDEVCWCRGVYVVTANTTFTIPAVLNGGFNLRSGMLHQWMVEAHGEYATVDDMASPVGYASPFGIDKLGTFPGGGSPQGPRTGNGTFTVSDERYFTYQP